MMVSIACTNTRVGLDHAIIKRSEKTFSRFWSLRKWIRQNSNPNYSKSNIQFGLVFNSSPQNMHYRGQISFWTIRFTLICLYLMLTFLGLHFLMFHCFFFILHKIDPLLNCVLCSSAKNSILLTTKFGEHEVYNLCVVHNLYHIPDIINIQWTKK